MHITTSIHCQNRVLTLDKLHITNYKWTKAPQYNKCWNLEFLQDNSKALAGRCLEEWVTILQKIVKEQGTKSPRYRQKQLISMYVCTYIYICTCTYVCTNVHANLLFAGK